MIDASILSKFSKEEIEKIIKALDITHEENKKQTEPELIREIEPIERWVNNPYYVGKDGLKLYKFWKDALIDVFGTHKGQYNEIICEGGLGCTELSTKKRTSHGYLSLPEIDDLKKSGVKVFVKTEAGEEEVKDVHFIGKQKTKILHFKDGFSYECTTNHLFRAIVDGEVKWIRADQLKPEDYILRTMHDGLFPEESLCDEGKYAYTIGYFIGDGDYNEDRGVLRIGICDHKYDTESYSYILNQMKELSGTNHVGIYESENTSKGIRTGHTCRRFTVYNVKYPDMFIDCGIGAYNKHIPDYMNCFTKEEICLLLAGLFDSDGCVEPMGGNKVEISYYSVNKQLVLQIQNLLFNLGINSIIRTSDRIKNNKRCIDYRLRISAFYSIRKFYELIPLKVEYKKEKIRKFIEYKISNENFNRTSSSLLIYGIRKELYDFCRKHSLVAKVNVQKNINRNGVSLGRLKFIKDDLGISLDDSELLSYLYENQAYSSQIESIEDSEAECGDIEIEGSHTYISDGIINHNTGKSTVGTFILIRKLYEISCYRNIAGLFDLMSSASVVFMYFSLTKQQAELTGFRQFRETVDSIPYFQEHFCRNMKLSSILEFPENVVFRHGARLTDQIGSNLIASIMDEANFFSNDGSAADAGALSAIQELHMAVLNRGASRFMANGVNSSISVLISSPTYSSSYTQQRIEASIGNPHAKVFRCRLWDCKPDKYSKERFYVFLGNEKVDPFIIRDVEDLNNALEAEMCKPYLGNDLKEGIATMPPRMREKIDSIPIDFRDKFEQNLLQSIMDIAGKSVAPSGRLFSSRKIWNACISDSIPQVFTKNELSITTEDDSDRNTLQYYLKDKFIDPHLSHYIHIDQSYAHDSTGFAICHRGESVERNGSLMPTIVIDCALRINPPPPPKKISISRVRSFIFYCIKNLKLNIAKVTYDSFSSAESIQTLKENGVNAEMQSVDRTDDAYLGFIDLLYDSRVTFNKMDADLMATEIFDLVHYRERHKVDHQPSGCFSGQTKIKVCGEGNVAISALVGRTDVQTYGIDDSGDIIIVPIKKIWKVKDEDRVTKVRVLNLDDGQIVEIICTREHMFLLKNGSYVDAKSLRTGMPLAGFGKHAVASIMNYTMTTPIPVYDMESPMTHNYCLGNGIIVHNSKDVMDAVVGCVYSAIKDKDSEFQTPQQLSAGLKGNYDDIDDDDIFSRDELLVDYPYRV